MPVAFDTLAYAKKLQALGVPAPQAEAQAEAFSEVVLANLVSRRDLAEVDASLKHELKELELRLTLRLGGVMMAGVAAIAALIKFV